MVNHHLFRDIRCAAAGVCFLAGVYAPAVHAAPALLNVDLNTSRYMSMPSPIERIAVGNPEIATVVLLPSSDTEFLIVSHKPGTTSLFIWSEEGERFEYIIGVSAEDTGRAQIIQNAIGLPFVHVKMVEGKVLLSGMVKNQYERNYAVRTAQLYVNSGSGSNISVGSNVNMKINAQSAMNSSGGTVGGEENKEAGNVIDLLHMMHPTQIRLEAQVISINPEDRMELGIRYSGSADTDTTSGGTAALSAPGIFFGGESYSTTGATPWRNSINVALSALVTQSRAKILSRPSITTMSGEEAVIQVGGEIPYTARDSNGNSHTEFKNYGIILQFKPVVDAENRIVSSIHTEISKPNGESVNGQPVLERRRADSVVTVSSGSTMVIGGLMDSSEAKSISKIPLLGDIPILGEFFKYTSKTKDKQELVVLITPYIVDEEDVSHTRMSEDLQKLYEKGQQEKTAQKDVDLNEPVPEPGNPSPKTGKDEDTILKWQLDRSVLPIPDKTKE